MISAREPHDALLEMAFRLSEGEDVAQRLASDYKAADYIRKAEIDRLVTRLHDSIGHDHDADETPRSRTFRTRLRTFLDALMLRYIRPYDTRRAPYLLEAPTPLTEQDLRNGNRWQLVADQYRGTAPLFDTSGNEYVYPGDKSLLDRFNATTRPDCRLILNIFPYPFVGNPLTAKIIILSENPGYVDHCNNTFARILQLIPSLAEGVVAHHRAMLRLDGASILPPPTPAEPDLTGSTCRDAGNILGEWYWHTRFSHFVEAEGIDRETLYSNVAIVQYLAYSSKNYGHITQTLPSQYLTRQLVDYLTRRESPPLFVILRARKLWADFLGTRIYNRMLPRCIINTNRAQHLSETCLGRQNYNLLLRTLKKL